MHGALNFGLLYRMCHVVPVAFGQHLHQSFVQTRIAVVGAQCFGVADGLGGVLPVDQMPSGQVKKNTAGHFAVFGPPMFVAQQRHHLVQVELAVVVGAANVHTRGGQHV